MKKSLVTLLVAAGTCAAQPPVTGIKLVTDPPGARVRPLESIVVQVKAYGRVAKANGDGFDVVRLLRTGATMKVASAPVDLQVDKIADDAPIQLGVEDTPAADSSGRIHLDVAGQDGWISKPFKFQGKDDENFYQEAQSRFGAIFGSLSRDYVVQDAYLYTAPAQPGKYEVQADLDGATASLTIEVADDAPSTKTAEKHSFSPETHTGEPFRALAERWAPMLAQETWFQPKADTPSRFDYDGDWRGNDNWEDLDEGSSQAYVYYTVMETSTHWFLIYNVYHPRDYSDKCVIGTCHENDNEGLILTVRRDGSEFGQLQAMETLAHNNVYSFVNDSRIRNGIHNVDGQIDFTWDGHPIAFVESGGHGIYGTQSAHAAYDVALDEFTGGTGVTYVYKGEAEQPRAASDRDVGYDLLPIYDQWWAKAYRDSKWDQPTFDDYFNYQPYGGRPRVPYTEIGGAFLGRREAENKAKPFWGWFDNTTLKARVLATGQWGLDPAYAASRDLRFPQGEGFSLTYTYNPYLGIGGSDTQRRARQ